MVGPTYSNVLDSTTHEVEARELRKLESITNLLLVNACSRQHYLTLASKCADQPTATVGTRLDGSSEIS